MDVAKEEIVKTEELETRYERYKGILKDLTIMSDVFMRNVLKEISCTEYILQVIMNKKELKVIDQTLQKDYKNLQGRSAILDCVAKDVENNFLMLRFRVKTMVLLQKEPDTTAVYWI